MKNSFTTFFVILLLASCAFADSRDEVNLIRLPAPAKSCDMSLIEAITNRHTARDFDDTDLTLQELSDLLYATAGVNRSNGLRVYPVAMDIQDTSVYVFDSEGVYKYDALSHSLSLITAGDHRQETGKEFFVGKAAVNLAYVQDTNLWKGNGIPIEVVKQCGFAHTGAAMQNAYLFAASRGWNSVVRGSFDSKHLAGLMKLDKGQEITLVHSIGPKP